MMSVGIIDKLVSIVKFLDDQKLEESYLAIQGEIEFLTNEIKNLDNFEETQKIFDQFEKFQLYLSILSFKYKFELTPYLNEFVSKYDRLDDLDERRRIYEELKQH